MRRPRVRTAVMVLVLAMTGISALPLSASGHTVSDDWVTSHDGTQLAVTVYQPAGADAANPVPMILHSHGWGGSRTSDPNAFQTELARGFGVLSFDQRGFGETGGRATVQNPDIEGRDVIAIIDYVAALDWVANDLKSQKPGGALVADPDDPVLFAMGGSYGGGYQFVGALTEIRDSGDTRFNALAPEITWFDLPESLAPDKVARSAWLALLYAAGLEAHEDDVHVAFAYGSATGQWPDGTVPGVPDLDTRFHRNGPVAFVEAGIQLDIPVLIGQGSSDNLFNLNQGWKNFEQTLTGRARSHSVFIGYNGGHALPNVLPAGEPFALEVGSNVDTCSPGGFGTLRLDFFDKILDGKNPRSLVGGSPYSVMTVDGDCVRLASLDDHTALPAGVDVKVTRGTLTTTGAGAPQHLELVQGPASIAGIPLVEADVTSLGADQRVFFALSTGATPATAVVVHNNVMPLRELLPVLGEHRTIELAGVAVDVPAGENLYLTITPVSDMFGAHGSTRSPGSMIFEDITVHLPNLS